MTLIPYILIAIPACLLAIAVWTYFDYRKYKKKNSLILCKHSVKSIFYAIYQILTFAHVNLYLKLNEQLIIVT